MEQNRILIAYFSRKGNNYVNGEIINLAIGNTEVIARKLQELTGSDLFPIETTAAYPEDYRETTEVAKVELRQNARPELTGRVPDMDGYDVVFLGYPNWWGTMPMAVHTFLEQYDFSGKTVVPFCTHEGSGMGHSERDVQKLCPKARVPAGLAIRGGRVNDADEELKKWLGKLNIR